VLIYNYGFADCWEFVVQEQFETPLSAKLPDKPRGNGSPPQIYRKAGGSSGPDRHHATEFGPLPPKINGDRAVEFSWGSIVSQRWE
jgi:hypothetical protein